MVLRIQLSDVSHLFVGSDGTQSMQVVRGHSTDVQYYGDTSAMGGRRGHAAGVK